MVQGKSQNEQWKQALGILRQAPGTQRVWVGLTHPEMDVVRFCKDYGQCGQCRTEWLVGDAHIQSGRSWGFLEGDDIAGRWEYRRRGHFMRLIGGATLLGVWGYGHNSCIGLYGAADGAAENLWRQALGVRHGYPI